MLINTIKADQLQARKNKISGEISLLTTLLGEASMPGKNDGNRESTDEEVIAVIKKFIKNANEIIKAADGGLGMSTSAQAEIDILEKYLPKQLSEAELVIAINEIVDDLPEKNPRAMGQVMGMLKKKYQGNYDGKSASTLVKAALV